MNTAKLPSESRELFWTRAKILVKKMKLLVFFKHDVVPLFSYGFFTPLAPLLTTKSEWADQLTVTVNVVCTKVSQQVTTATDFLHQTTVSSVVFFVLFNVFVKVVDFPSKDSNLNLYWTSVTFVTCVLSNDFIFFLFWDCHVFSPFFAPSES